MRFRLIDAAKKEFPVQRLCKVLGVSQSGYFAWKDRPACRRQHEDMVLLAHIRSAFALSNATYGSPRMTRELRDDGITIGRHRVARLMRENALKARQRRRFKRTTDSLHAFPVAPNLLNQDFNATGPNQKWGADISYVWTREGWLYLAVVIDLFARRVVGWAAGDRLHKELALLALRRAVAGRLYAHDPLVGDADVLASPEGPVAGIHHRDPADQQLRVRCHRRASCPGPVCPVNICDNSSRRYDGLVSVGASVRDGKRGSGWTRLWRRFGRSSRGPSSSRS